jgi:hypothetical protein
MLQYSLRRTRVSRAILLALPVVLGVAAVVAHQRTLSGQALMDRMYPALAAGSAVPVQFSFAPSDHSPFYVSRGKSPVGIRIPIAVSGIADGVSVFAESERVTIEAADGYSWSTDVTDYNPQRFIATSRRTSSGFFIPREVYDRFKSSPVTLRLTFGITQLQATNSEHIAMPTRDVAVPGFGVCGGPYVGYGLIKCRSALREPPLTYVSADWSSTPCPASQTAMEEVRGEFWGLSHRVFWGHFYAGSEQCDRGKVPVPGRADHVYAVQTRRSNADEPCRCESAIAGGLVFVGTGEGNCNYICKG